MFDLIVSGLVLVGAVLMFAAGLYDTLVVARNHRRLRTWREALKRWDAALNARSAAIAAHEKAFGAALAFAAQKHPEEESFAAMSDAWRTTVLKGGEH